MHYGSVMGTTPVVVRRGADDVMLVEVQNLARELGMPDATWMPCGGGKESYEMASGAQALTHDGWTALERVVRRTLPAGVPMVRVWTSAGMVDVAGDDALVCGLRLGDIMLHTPRPVAAAITDTDDVPIPLADARVEGRGARIHTRIINTDAIALAVGGGVTAEEIVRFIANDLQARVSTADPLAIRGVHFNGAVMSQTAATMRHLRQLQAAHVAQGGAMPEVTAAFEKGRDMRMAANLTDAHRVPITAPREIRAAFWAGLAGVNNDGRSLHFRGIEKSANAAHAWMIAESLGVRVRLAAPMDVFSISLACENNGEDDAAVQGLVTLEVSAPPPLVYNLSTANRHYAAGVGRMVL